MPEYTLCRTNRADAAFVSLCHMLNSELGKLLTGDVDPIASRANHTEDFTDVILALTEGEPVGCIALRPFSESCGEIKRMYVLPSKRKSGIGRALLENCIAVAKAKGYRAVVLETNEKLPVAKQFYEKNGFVKMDSYGPYAALAETLCMKKEL